MDCRISYLWREPKAAAGYNSAVSLHGHTNRSREGLHFIADLAKGIPPLQWALARETARARSKGGIAVDFHASYWLPPLTPRAAYRIESQQIAEALDLAPVVSLTDHDNIEAAGLLRTLPDSSAIPISLEWSVPYEGIDLHLGVHNLPPKDAQPLVAEMNDYTRNPSVSGLVELLAALHANREVLVVLNHPMWDLSRVGEGRHRQVMTKWMAAHGQYIHAFELGGLRGWSENQRTLEFAAGWNQSVISGGDRHGHEPNACVNLTRAASFAEFADEVRHGRSHLLFMPQYAESLAVRIIHIVNDATRLYPQSSFGARWDERVYHPDQRGTVRPLSQIWDAPPAYIGAVLSVFRWFESANMQRAAQAFRRPEAQLRITWTGETL